MTLSRLRARCGCARGQALVEFSFVLPLLSLLALGVVELSYALLDEHMITKLSREGSNLISRDATLSDAVNALKGMSAAPVDFATRSSVILSVLKRVSATGFPNDGKDIVYQRYQYGALQVSSALKTKGTGSFGGAPEFVAANANTDTNLQLTNLPANLMVSGGTLYVTEIFTTHSTLTPLDKFGISVPNTLYSIAYF
jgi:hypothetical protein